MRTDILLGAIGCETSGRREGDYEVDGLLYCGVCRKPKQTQVPIPYRDGTVYRKVPVACDCDKERYKREDAERERLEREAKLREIRHYSLMTDTQLKARFENAERGGVNEKNLRVAERYCERFDEFRAQGRGLIFHGTCGTGKSYTAACIANRLCERGTSVMMTSFVRLLGGAYGADEEFTHRMTGAQLLILDDLGAERGTDWSLERVYNVIDSRVRSGLPMVVTTNLSIRQMQDETDTRLIRIYDRIFSKCFPMEFRGGSRRLDEAARMYDEMSAMLGG